MKDVVRLPQDFIVHLKSDMYVHDFFMKIPPSHKKEYIAWIDEAKKPETREKRIKESVQMIRKKYEQGRYY
jgi:uncharacterized protein YdeI (YjbR/CyaY-like superfamily)